MGTMNYSSMDSDPCQDVRSPTGGKQKLISGRKNVFRRSTWLSIAKSESSSMPSVVPLDSSSLGEEFRDEVSSFRSDEKNTYNYNYITSNETSPTEAFSQRDNHISGSQMFNPFEINMFEFNPSWDFDDSDEKDTDEKAELQKQPLIFGAQPDALEMNEDSKNRSTSQKSDYRESQSHSSRPIILIRPAALKLDQWSNVLVGKKKQFKYQSFSNEKRVSRSKKSPKAKPVMPSFENAIVEDRNEKEQIDYGPEKFPSFNDLFHPIVCDERQREGTSIGPLLPNTTLRLMTQDIPKDLSRVSEVEERDQPSCDVLPLETVSKEERDVAPSKVETSDDKIQNHKQKECSKNEVTKNETKDSFSDDSSDWPSDGDYSSIISENTENLPLLKAWGMKLVDCNRCGSKKSRKKKVSKKKKSLSKKKLVEDIWERKQFYWKYETIDDRRKALLHELDTLVFKLAPETGFVEMPLGFQLSTITEGDEDVTASCSHRSTISLGVGSFQQDGKVTLNTPFGSILDNIFKDAVISRSKDEDEIEGFPQIPQPQGPYNETSGGSTANSSKPESSKVPMRSAHPRGVLMLDEIVVPATFDDGSTEGSKDAMSDITEDYLHIPFSSPLYTKVITAFREAAKLNDGYNDREEMNYLRSVKF